MRYLAEAKAWGIELDGTTLSFAFQNRIQETLSRIDANPHEPALFEELLDLVLSTRQLSFRVDLGRLQAQLFQWCQTRYRRLLEQEKRRLPVNKSLGTLIRSAAEEINVAIPDALG